MNRRPATAIDSDDSESDWDTTAADSPTHPEPPKLTAAPTATFKEESEGDYATIVAKPRTTLKDPDRASNGRSPRGTPRKETSQSKSSSPTTSPPPHMTSFQKALSSDYSTPLEIAAPDIPPRGYEGKAKMYTIPETDHFPSPQTNRPAVNWDDSDAEERVLRELQQNLEKDKQRQAAAAAARDRKVTLASAERPAGLSESNSRQQVNSPSSIRSSESSLEKWARANEKHQRRSPMSHKEMDQNVGVLNPVFTNDSGNPAHLKMTPGRQGMTTPPMFVKDTNGKKYIFFFQEGSPHFLEAGDDDVDAFLPEKIERLEKLFQRVWREIFTGLRVVSSIFIIFITELVLFLTNHIVRPLVVENVKHVGDYVLKPILTTLFNSIVQPALAFVWNLMNNLAQALEPLNRLLGNLFSQVAILLRAFRLVSISYGGPPRYRNELDVV